MRKVLAVLLSASLVVAATGCGESRMAEESNADAEKSVIEEIDDKQAILDFDEFVNGEWKKQKQTGNESAAATWDELYQSEERLKDILDNTDLNEISEEEGLYKAVSIYRHIQDTADYSQRIESAKEHLKQIEDINSLEDIYQLYSNEEYMLYSEEFQFIVAPDYIGINSTWFNPNSMTSDIDFYKNLISGKEADAFAGEQLLNMMEMLGYSEARTVEMLDNASFVCQMIDGYWNEQVENTVVYYDSEILEKENVSAPVIEILENLNALGRDKEFIAKDNFCQFINDLYQKENVPAIKDHMLFGAISKLLTIYAGDVIKAAYGTEYKDVAYSAITKYAPDVINEAYNEKYLKDFNEQQALDMIEDIKNSYRDIIKNTDWLSTHGKELANHKILYMRASLGKNEIQNDLSDLELTGNIVDDYISLLISRERFIRSQAGKEDDKRQIFNAKLSEVNAYYISGYNALYVTSGILANPNCSNAASYEEMLAYFGMRVAHEYGHSYDPYGINFDWHGYWENWMTEDEYSAYNIEQQRIADFFDGMEVGYGRKLDGNSVKNETYADLIAMKCCLNILNKMENPDYDLFFRTYAKTNACYITEDDIDYVMSGGYLPGKERINFILGQFDEFYDVYDIDENSPYFVPKEKRLSVF